MKPMKPEKDSSGESKLQSIESDASLEKIILSKGMIPAKYWRVKE